MALIKSISGIRGTIGGRQGDTFSPLDVIKFTAAYGCWLKEQSSENADQVAGRKVVIGRDARISGELIRNLVVSTLNALGFDTIDLGLSTTPTVELAVTMEHAAGGIIITASHNPKEWNALKLLNHKGEFISANDGKRLLDIAEKGDFTFVHVDRIGSNTVDDSYMQKHIDAIMNYELVDVPAIKKAKFKIVVDGINSTGASFVPSLLRAMGVKDITILNEEVNGNFAHNPEPLPQHLNEISSVVNRQQASLGIVVDPDVDRLCFVCEDGSFFGEEYTLVAVADYILSHRPGNTVSNMSSTKALKELTILRGGEYFPSSVGEVNVVTKMKEVNAVIGGEGNGGIIVPDFHYGRDALIGIALFLTHLAHSKKSMTALRSIYPSYFISKNKIELNNGFDIGKIFGEIKKKYKNQPINTEDGLKIEFDNDWVHLRTSNTEPIIRIYSESDFETKANNIAMRLMQDIKEFM